jgi:hypothetical protein
MIRIQIENHNIAIAGGAEQINPILICLKLDFEFLAERGGEKRMERPVFRIKPDLDHYLTRSLTVPRLRRFQVRSGKATNIDLKIRLKYQ